MNGKIYEIRESLNGDRIEAQIFHEETAVSRVYSMTEELVSDSHSNPYNIFTIENLFKLAKDDFLEGISSLTTA